MDALILGDGRLDLDALEQVARGGRPVAISGEVWRRVDFAREVVLRLAGGSQLVYGLNTGLGGNLAHRLHPDEIEAFQAQLIRGRAVAVGPPLPDDVVRAGLLARANGMARGVSGVARPVLALLVEMLNRGVTPLVPAWGSIGVADLVPMAHLALVMLGEGEARVGDEVLPGAEALRRVGLEPVAFGPKDGLGLINANALTVGHAALVLGDARRLLLQAVAIAALACEGYAANLAAFDARTMTLRPAAGQERAATLLRALLDGSSLQEPGAARSVQDTLSFRCLPQILGAALASLEAAQVAVEVELNGAGDNPAVLVETGSVQSTGNFHLAGLALAFDALAIGLAQMAHAACARIVKLMSASHAGLPRYLSPVGGPSAGLVPMQKAAGAVLAEIRLKAGPATLDALAISDFVEDHASHAPLAVRKLEEQLRLLARLVAIEACTAAQAVDLRQPARLGRGTRLAHAFVRARIAPLQADRPLGAEVEELAQRLLAGALAADLQRADFML